MRDCECLFLNVILHQSGADFFGLVSGSKEYILSLKGCDERL